MLPAGNPANSVAPEYEQHVVNDDAIINKAV